MAAAAVTAHRLTRDAGPLKQKHQSIGKKLRLAGACGGTERSQALALLGLVAFDHFMGGMTLPLQLNCRIGEIATCRFSTQTLGPRLNPRVKLRTGIARMRHLKITPNLLGFFPTPGAASRRPAHPSNRNAGKASSCS